MEDDVRQSSADRYAVSQAYRWKAERDKAMQELRQLKKDVEGRLMPEGMEWLVEVWPRFEDGKPVNFGDTALIDGDADMVEAVQLWIHGKPVIYGDGGSQQLDKGERVKRPAPKVLDADGEEIEVGDDLYSVEGMLKFHVSAIDKKSGRIATEAMFALDKWADPKMYTHRAPVLAADGKPLEVGQTVWDWNGDGYVVERIYSGTTEPDFPGHTVACRRPDDVVTHMFKPSQLTHQRPESWERLMDDATQHPWYYCKRYDIETDAVSPDSDLAEVVTPFAQDLVRRAKKLAGVSE